MPVNVLLITLDQFRGDCLSAPGTRWCARRTSIALAAQGVRLARHYSQAAPCAPGRAEPLHGHVPDEQPGGRQRHAARRPLRQRRAAPAAGPGYRRRCSATPTRASTRASPTGPTTRGCRPTRACCPGSTPCSTCATTTSRGWRWLAELGHDTSPGCEALLATERERPAEHSLVHVPHRPRRRLDRAPGRAVVRPPQLPAPAPALRRRRALGRRRTTRPTSICRSLPPRPPPVARRRARRSKPIGRADGRGGAARDLRAQYFGMISEVDAQLGRVWDVLARTGSGTTPSSS